MIPRLIKPRFTLVCRQIFHTCLQPNYDLEEFPFLSPQTNSNSPSSHIDPALWQVLKQHLFTRLFIDELWTGGGSEKQIGRETLNSRENTAYAGYETPKFKLLI